MNSDRKDNNSKGGKGRGKGGNRNGGKRNDFSKDPLKKEFDLLKKKHQQSRERYGAKFEEIKKVQDTPYITKMKECREHLNKNVFPPLEELKKKEKKILEVINKIKEEKRSKMDEIKEVATKSKKKDESFSDWIQRNASDVDKQLNILNNELREIKNLSEEKRIVTQIEKLKNKKRKILSFDVEQGNRPNFDKELSELRAKKQKYRDDLKATKEVISKNQELHDQISGRVDKLRGELNAIGKERDALLKQVDAKRKELDVRWEEYKKEEEVKRKQRDIEFKERKAKEEAEKAETARKQKLEDAMKPPRGDELKQCTELLTYLKSLKVNKKKSNAKIVHSLDSFSLFAPFKMSPPQKGSQIPDMVKTITEKKEEIEAEQKAFLVKRAAEIEAEEAEAAKKAAEAPAAEEAPAAAEEPAAAAEEPAAAEEAPDAAEEPATEEAKEDTPAEPEAETPAEE